MRSVSRLRHALMAYVAVWSTDDEFVDATYVESRMTDRIQFFFDFAGRFP